MASTYEPIATTTLGTAASSFTFSSIPATYTDLKLVFVGTCTSTTHSTYIRFNSVSTGGLYSQTYIYADGTSVLTSRYASQNQISNDGYALEISATIPELIEIDIFSYAGSTNKTFLSRVSQNRNGSGATGATVGLFRSTSAITSITLTSDFFATFAIGTTATLYGIKAA
jgi:hypothetical protein